MGGPEDNKALVRRFYAELDAGNLEAMDEIFWRVTDGMLSEHWGEVDSFRLMQQLGVIPMPDLQPGA